MNVKPTDQLMDEHTTIKTMTSILQAVAARLESGHDVDAGHMESMVEFIRLFADRYHHGKEEDLLFAAMEDAGIPREGGPIAVMLQEHDVGRGYVRGMSDAIAAYKAADKRAARDIASNARAYAELLTDHIAKENEILYPMANAHIPPATQHALLERFEGVEEDKIGSGRADGFRELVSHLEQVYLG